MMRDAADFVRFGTPDKPRLLRMDGQWWATFDAWGVRWSGSAGDEVTAFHELWNTCLWIQILNLPETRPPCTLIEATRRYLKRHQPGSASRYELALKGQPR